MIAPSTLIPAPAALVVPLAGMLVVAALVPGCDDSNSRALLECGDLDCNHGVCLSPENDDAVCVCELGWATERCDECASGFVLRDGSCVELCLESPCHRGTCVVVEGEPFCHCDPRWQGQLCDVCANGFVLDGGECTGPDETPCTPNPCVEPRRTVCMVIQMGGSGSQLGYTCDCDPGSQPSGDDCLVDSLP